MIPSILVMQYVFASFGILSYACARSLAFASLKFTYDPPFRNLVTLGWISVQPQGLIRPELPGHRKASCEESESCVVVSRRSRWRVFLVHTQERHQAGATPEESSSAV
jgi:hypothetical protein